MEAFNKLVDWFAKNGDNKAIVALSGGVDSAVVALAAKKSTWMRGYCHNC